MPWSPPKGQSIVSLGVLRNAITLWAIDGVGMVRSHQALTLPVDSMFRPINTTARFKARTNSGDRILGMYGEKRLSERIAAIGPSLLFDYNGLTEVGAALNEAVSGVRITIAVTPQGETQPTVVSLTNYDQSYVSSYIEHFRALNPWPAHYPMLRHGVAVRSRDCLPYSELTATPFYHDWLKPQGEADDAVGVRLSENEGAVSVLLANFDYRRSDADKEEIGRVLARASRDISRFLDFRQLTRVQDAARGGMIRHAPRPTWLLTRSGGVIDCNGAAEALMTGLRPDITIRARRLWFTDAIAQEAFAASIERLQRGVPAATLPAVRIGADRTMLFADAPSELDLGPLSAMVPGRVLATLVDPRAKSAPTPLMLSMQFGLTAAEAAVVSAIADGGSITDFAEERAVSRLTVRNQLRSAMEKIGVNRQGELISLVQRLSAMPRAPQTR